MRLRILVGVVASALVLAFDPGPLALPVRFGVSPSQTAAGAIAGTPPAPPHPAPSAPPREALRQVQLAPAPLPAPAPPPPPPPPPPLSGLAKTVDSRIRDPRMAGTTTSMSLWVDGLGEVAVWQPDLALLPASNQKIFTAMAVLASIPPTDVLLTEVRTAGPQDGATLVGDLVLVGGGDPTLTSRGPRSFDTLAAAVRARGITTVTGALVGDESRYDSIRGAPGWKPEHVPVYIGPLSALVVDRNQHRGDPPYAANPLPGNLARFRAALVRHGVRVAGASIAGVAPPGSAVLASVASPPVGRMVRDMMTRSDNLAAELLLKEVGFRRRGVGSTAEGIAAANELLAQLGVPLAGRSADGSGLSRGNLRSAREWRLLLQAALTRPWGPSFVESLPLAGRTGTLARRLKWGGAAGNVRAKTGWIDEARTLSGYLKTAGGRPAVFSILVNGTTPRSAVAAAIDDLVAAIAADRS